MVREYDTAPSLDLVLVVEPWLPANPTPQQREQLEAALSLAASLVRAWSRAYTTTVVIAVAGDNAMVRIATPTDASVRAALEPLAAVKGTAQPEPLAPQAFDRALARAVRVLVSSRPASPYAETLAQSTGRSFLAVSPLDGVPWYQHRGGVGS
jgi:hypothetical protein